MSHVDPNRPNPYAPASVIDPGAGLGADDAKLVKDFRAQSLALGVLWLIFGSLAAAALVFLGLGAFGQPQPGVDMTQVYILTGIVSVVGVGWFISGVLTLMKNMMGVYVGLGLSYLSLLGNLIRLNPCGAIIAVVIIFQAHRVIKFATEMRSRNIPLNKKI